MINFHQFSVLNKSLMLAVLLASCMAQAQAGSERRADKQTPHVLAASPIVHDRVRNVVLACERHQAPLALTGQSGDAVRAIDQEQLLLGAARNKAFPKSPPSSLAWMQSGLRTHGYTGTLAELRGPAQMAAMRIASLADNDYTIASQMAFGLHVRQGLFDKPLTDFIGYFILGLTESSHQTPETTNTNDMISQSMVYLEAMPPAVKGYAKWAVRAYAYDDTVAIEAAMAGVCMSSASKSDMASLGKAIVFAQFDPKHDYSRPKVFKGPTAASAPEQSAKP